MSVSARTGWLALLSFLISSPAHAQLPASTCSSIPCTVTQTVAASDQGVPLDFTLTIGTSGTYQVTLTDLGAALPATLGGPAALANVALAITDNSGNLVTGSTLTQPGTATFTANVGTYDIRVTGKPGANTSGSGTNPASGPVSVAVTANGGNTQIASFTGALVPSATTTAPTGDAVFSDTFTVSAQGSYQLTANDLQMPAALSQALVAIVQEGAGGSVVAAVVLPPGSPPPAGQANVSVTSPAFTLTPGSTYQIFAVGRASASTNSGLFSVVVSASGAGGAPAYPAKVIPIGSVSQLGPAAGVTLNTGVYTLTLTDLDVPNALQQASVVVAANGQAIAPAVSVPVASGSSSCPGSGSGASSSLTNCSTLNITSGSYEIFASGTATSAGVPGGYAVTLQSQGGGASALSVARAIATPGGAISAYSYDTGSLTAGSYAFDLTDFAFPAQFISIEALVAQNGSVLGALLPAVGTQNVMAQAGPASVLVFATPDSSGNGSLFGVDLTASGASTPFFETTQGVGTTFTATQVAITTAGSYLVSLNDLAFPAQFADLGIAVTQGTQKIGYIFGSGSLPAFSATPGDYTINVVAKPGGTDEAGTYAINVAAAPAAPTVSLSTDETSVASGGTVHIIWNSQNASSCQASSSPTGGGWSGNIAPNMSGQATSASLTVSTTFTLTCANTGGSTSKMATVDISAPAKGGGGAMSLEFLAILAGWLAIRLRRDWRVCH